MHSPPTYWHIWCIPVNSKVSNVIRAQKMKKTGYKIKLKEQLESGVRSFMNL